MGLSSHTGHIGPTKWAMAYKTTCVDMNHIHLDDTLPLPSERDEIDSDSENESIDNDNNEDIYQADWM